MVFLSLDPPTPGRGLGASTPAAGRHRRIHAADPRNLGSARAADDSSPGRRIGLTTKGEHDFTDCPTHTCEHADCIRRVDSFNGRWSFCVWGPGWLRPQGGPGGALGRPTTAGAVATASKKKSKVKVGPRGPAGPRFWRGRSSRRGRYGAAQAPQVQPGQKAKTGLQALRRLPAKKARKARKAKTARRKISPWQSAAHCRPGETEAGAWSLVTKTVDEENHEFVILFLSRSRSLAEESVTGTPVIEEEHVHFFAFEETAKPGEGCGEGSAAKPEAEPGNLCVYTTESVTTTARAKENVRISDPVLEGAPTGAGATGAILRFKVPSGAANGGFGTPPAPGR